MPSQKLILASFVIVLTLLSISPAAGNPIRQADIEKLQEQFQTQKTELALQREAFVRKLDDVEKRQNEISVQQANSLAAISNSTTMLGHLIAMAGILVTIGLGFLGYLTFSKAREAVLNAKGATAAWLEDNKGNFDDDIKKMRKSMADDMAKMRQLNDELEIKIENGHLELETKIADAFALVDDTANRAISIMQKPADRLALSDIDLEKIQRSTESLKSKPEMNFTANDFYQQGLSLLTKKNYQSALASFRSAYNSLDNTYRIRKADYLFAQSRALAALKNVDETIRIYDLLFQQFSEEKDAEVRYYVATSLLNKGLLQKDLGEKYEAIQTFALLAEKFGSDKDVRIRKLVSSGLTVQGYLSENTQDAIDIFDRVIGQFKNDNNIEVQPEVARAYVNKTYRLLDAGRLNEVSVVCTELENWAGQAARPAVVEQVAKGEHHKALAQIMTASRKTTSVEDRDELLKNALSTLQNALEQCAENYKYKILCSLGYALFLADKKDESRNVLENCLTSDKKNAFQRLSEYAKDPETYEAEPFNAELDEIWIKVSKKALS